MDRIRLDVPKQIMIEIPDWIDERDVRDLKKYRDEAAR